MEESQTSGYRAAARRGIPWRINGCLLAARQVTAGRCRAARILGGYHWLAGLCFRGRNAGALSRHARPHLPDSRRGFHGLRCSAHRYQRSFFQLHHPRLEFLWAPVAWWESRMVFALLLIVALLVERFLPRSHHPRRELAGALVTVIS